jgi:hypothetical protein
MEEPDQEQEAPPREAESLFGLACLMAALLLLVLLPFATKAQPADKAWFLSPRNVPVLGILMVGLPGLALALRLLREWRASPQPSAYLRRALSAFGDLGPAIGYTLLFCVYLFAIPWIGFALSTLVFGQACLWVSGLRGARWALLNLAFTAIVVFVLRGLMGLWFPFAAVFSLLPGNIGNVIGPYL